MNVRENVKEGLNSIKSNKLRTGLTAAIIATGITALVGIFTAIDGIQSSINESFNNLGANTFDVKSLRQGRGTQDGKEAKNYSPLKYDQLTTFKEKFNGEGQVSVNAMITWNAEVKYLSKVSNPNTRIKGGDYDYLFVDGHNVEKGRSFSQSEAENGVNVVILGVDIVKSLFEENENPIDKRISFLGQKFKVIGVLEKQGNNGGNNGVDRMCIIPMLAGRRLAAGRQLDYEATVVVNDPMKMDLVIGEANALMRAIRRDPVKQENSFDIVTNKSIAEELKALTDNLKIGGFVIGFITLLGASIGLMNIMLVSVTERTREIGVRKALGATPAKIRQQFLVEALVICQIGGVAGIIFGLIIGNVTSSFLSGVFVVPWVWIVFGVIMGMVVGLISGYIPASKASRLDPIDSLRFE